MTKGKTAPPTEHKRTPLLIVVGQTAVGKTDLSLRLAQSFNGEIISADSRLFYRGMDIGTAKPGPEAIKSVPHHMIDICEPDETITLGEYQQQAFSLIDQIYGADRLPMLVGGTGQYVKAISEGWGIPQVSPQPAMRAALHKLSGPELGRWLQALDPERAATLDLRNLRRVIRALEVALISGRPISAHQKKKTPPHDICIVGLHRPREILYRRIDQRVDQMMAVGLLDEVRQLCDRGFDRCLPAMSGIGYRQLLDYLAGEMSLELAIERIKFETHRFARHQANWFRLDDEQINWFDLEISAPKKIIQFVGSWLADR